MVGPQGLNTDENPMLLAWILTVIKDFMSGSVGYCDTFTCVCHTVFFKYQTVNKLNIHHKSSRKTKTALFYILYCILSLLIMYCKIPVMQSHYADTQ